MKEAEASSCCVMSPWNSWRRSFKPPDKRPGCFKVPWLVTRLTTRHSGPNQPADGSYFHVATTQLFGSGGEGGLGAPVASAAGRQVSHYDPQGCVRVLQDVPRPAARQCLTQPAFTGSTHLADRPDDLLPLSTPTLGTWGSPAYRLQLQHAILLHPGLLTLSGTSLQGGAISASLEVGAPSERLAPQLLAAVHAGRLGHQPHLLAIHAVHAIQLQPGALDSTAPPAPAGGARTERRGCASARALGRYDACGTQVPAPADAAAAAAGTAPDPRTQQASSPRSQAAGQSVSLAAGDSVRLPDLLPYLWRPGCIEDTLTLVVMDACDPRTLQDEIKRGAFLRVSERSGGGGSGSAGWKCSSLEPLHGLQSRVAVRRLALLHTLGDVLGGLAHLHTALGMPHGDLTSRNVLLHSRAHTCCAGTGDPRDYCARLAGYGRACAAAHASLMPAAPAPVGAVRNSNNPIGESSSSQLCSEDVDGYFGRSLTRTGSCTFQTARSHFLGSVHTGLWLGVHSLAPELLAGGPPSPEGDVYALGVLLHEMVCGEPPYAQHTPACIAVGVSTGELCVEVPGWVPPLMAQLIRACMEHDPAARPGLPAIRVCLDVLMRQANKEAFGADYDDGEKPVYISF